MVRYQYQHQHQVPHDEKQDLKSCCKVLAIALFGWAAIRVALIPFERGAFTPSNPDLAHGINVSSTDLDTSHQRVVLIVGPTLDALQQNLLEWSRTSILQKDWSYPIPTREEFKAVHFNAPPRYRSFDPLFATLEKDPTYYEYKDIPIDNKLLNSIVFLYHNRSQKAWKEKKNLVIASNEASHVVNDYLDLWLESLPDNALSNLQVVLVYPRLRSLQLLRLFHASSAKTMAEFVKSGALARHFSDLNPLGVAETFVKKGATTIILDEAGFVGQGVDLTAAVACLILKVRCSTSGIVGIKDYKKTNPPAVSLLDNKSKKDTVSESKLKEVEKVLQDFDCGFYDLLSKSSNVHFLYREFLFESCVTMTSRQYTPKTALHRIETILKRP